MAAASRRRLSTNLVLLTALSFFWGACAGGCGEEADTGEESAPAATGSGPAKGSGDVNLSFYDTDDRRAAPESSEPTRQAAPKETAHRPGVVRTLSPSGYAAALSGMEDVLMMTFMPVCTDCEIIRSVLKDLAGEFGGIRFYRISAKNGKTFLPDGMAAGPFPGFIYFIDRKSASTRKGLPLERKRYKDGSSKESLEAYQGRLKEWFRRACKRRYLGEQS